jgi:SAM-dependent methyltransferase
MDEHSGHGNRTDVWDSGDAYEPYVGRWSRLVAREFLGWLAIPTGCRWLDVGCGTGALAETILALDAPSEVVGDRAVSEMARVARPGGVVAAYVWDYAEGMQMMRHFWDAAGALDPRARELDEGRRFTLCKPEPLIDLFQSTGLEKVEVRAIDVPTVFRDFDDYWSPFLGGQAPAPGYAMSLSQERRAALREQIRASLPANSEGEHHLVARAWAVRGVR